MAASAGFLSQAPGRAATLFTCRRCLAANNLGDVSRRKRHDRIDVASKPMPAVALAIEIADESERASEYEARRGVRPRGTSLNSPATARMPAAVRLDHTNGQCEEVTIPSNQLTHQAAQSITAKPPEQAVAKKEGHRDSAHRYENPHSVGHLTLIDGIPSRPFCPKCHLLVGC